jgi:hypothetical protein
MLKVVAALKTFAVVAVVDSVVVEPAKAIPVLSNTAEAVVELFVKNAKVPLEDSQN